MEFIISYIGFILLMFFITFFISIFVQYFRTRTVTPTKMFTYKRGGVFEHYIIVGIITAIVLGLHVGVGLNPFPVEIEDSNILSTFITAATMMIVGFIFMVFLFIFAFYFLAHFYLKIAKNQDKKTFYEKNTHRMIATAFGLSIFLIGAIVLAVILGA